MSLDELKIGKSAFIDVVLNNTPFSKRLKSLGCIKGTEIKLKKIAPFGDPIIINIHGFYLAIRK